MQREVLRAHPLVDPLCAPVDPFCFLPLQNDADYQPPAAGEQPPECKQS